VIRRLAFVLAALLWLTLGAACPQPLPPVPPGPTPATDAAPSDLFEGAVVDCSSAAPAPLDQLRTCLDVANTAACLADLTATNTPATIACEVRAESQRLHLRVARGTATETETVRAGAADGWIRAKRIGFRGRQGGE
jgi:hypothetical protein